MEKFKLENNAKKTIFQIPEGYFEAFENKMLHKINLTPEKKLNKNVFKQYRNIIFKSAAVFVLVFSLTLFIPSKKNTTVSSSQIEDYLLSQTSTEDALFWDEIVINSDDLTVDLKLSLDTKELENYVEKNIDVEYDLD
jgi:hypothetical protein